MAYVRTKPQEGLDTWIALLTWAWSTRKLAMTLLNRPGVRKFIDTQLIASKRGK